MDVRDKMTIADAKSQFLNIMTTLTESDKQAFLAFIAKEWKPALRVRDGFLSDKVSSKRYDLSGKLGEIISDIKKMVPLDAILDSEDIKTPETGENSDCDPLTTLHVDAFLYDDYDFDRLLNEGKLQDVYCGDCGSRKIYQSTVISHSMSVETMYYVFKYLLPSLNDKVVLDVGSRLGAVLYGAYEFSTADRIIGVEMNAEFCDLQREIIKKHNMENRIEVVNKKIEECADLLRICSVIIINNAFEFYVSESTHRDIWYFLKANIPKGTIIVTIPDLATTLDDLRIGFDMDEWVHQFVAEVPPREDLVPIDHSKYCCVGCYRVR